jgi:hypothetical protein
MPALTLLLIVSGSLSLVDRALVDDAQALPLRQSNEEPDPRPQSSRRWTVPSSTRVGNVWMSVMTGAPLAAPVR